MSVPENVAIMKRWFHEIWNEGRMETVRELMDEHGIGFGQAGHDTRLRGPDDFIPFVQRFRGAFPDMRLTVEDAFGENDRVAVRWSATMTHSGQGLDIPPSNRKVNLTGITIVRMVRGKLMEGWDSWDQLALLRQIGALPELGADPSHPKFVSR